MTYLSEIKNKNIVILGGGLTGLSCARFLNAHNISFAINDNRENVIPEHEISAFNDKVIVEQGQWHRSLLKNADIVLVSPGIDMAVQQPASLINPKADIFGDIELFLRLSDTSVVAVTGSNGKSTVVSLLCHIGKQLNKKVALGGNIGVPVLDRLTEDPLELLILELSSFQLETVSSLHAQAACILNISDDHLDRHQTLDNYTAIKQKIYQNSKTVVFNREDKATIPTNTRVEQKTISFGLDTDERRVFSLITIKEMCYLAYDQQALIALKDLPLAGIHNGLNYLATLAIGQSVGWGLAEMLNACQTFTGLAHRCEKVATDDGIQWINDSKATNVGAALAAIEGLAGTLTKGCKLILIAGGDGKGADFSALAAAVSTHVAHIVALGKDGKALCALSENSDYVSSLAAAVKRAKMLANAGDIVLLSPACASIDMFKNFIERGQMFVELVQESAQ